MELLIGVADGELEDLRSLQDWLSYEDQLRGRIRMQAPAPGPEQMGALATTLSVALGGGGALSVLVASLQAWLNASRRASITIEVTANGASKRVTIDAASAAAAERLLQQALPRTGDQA